MPPTVRLTDLEPQQHTLLIVDDNPTNLGVLTDYLKDYGFTILNARDGETALKRASLAKPDLILLDVMMPGLDGFETCRRLKADPVTQAIPVIFMTALTNPDDKVTGFEAGAVDYVTKPLQQTEVLARVITHLRLRALARVLEQKNAELAELNASKDRFFSIVAHDLRAPFNPLLGLAQFLAATAAHTSPEDIQQIANSIYNSARSIYALLENLLAWASAESGRMKYAPVLLDLHEVARQNCKLLADTAAQKNITLQADLPAPTLAKADPDMAHAIVRNLLSNALKFTPRGGLVTLRAQPGPTGLVEVLVTDNGVGMGPMQQAKLFQLTVHSTVGTADERGTGLGLLLCKELVERHGGRIWVESTVGVGTTIHFTLPALPAAPA